MSYRYRRRYRRPYRRRRFNRRPRSKFGGYLSTASKALAIAYGVKRMLNVEYKIDDTALSGGVDNSGSVTCINQIATGDTYTTRDGSQVKVVSVQINGHVTPHASVTTGTGFRIMLVLVTHKDDDGPTVAGGEQGILTAGTITSMRNLDTTGTARNRYVTLWDKKISIPNSGTTYGRTFSFYKKVNLKCVYNNTDNIPRKNALYVLMLSTEATNTPTVTGYARIRYLDN